MVKQRLRLYSWHTFLVVPFIVLFLYAHNPGQGSVQMTFRTLAIGLLFTAVLFAAAYLVLRNRLRTGIFVTIMLFALFQYGVAYEFLEQLYYSGRWPLKNIHRYLVIGYIIFLSVILIYMKRSRRPFIRANIYLNVLVSLLLLFNVLRIATSSEDTGDEAPSLAVAEKTPGDTTRNFPNIYFIVLDGYASRHVLSKYYGYDNSPFYQSLKSLQFHVTDSAFANYYFTSLSLAATLNMDYLQHPEKAQMKLNDNRLFRVLKKHGYRIYNLRSGYAVTGNLALVDSTVFVNGPNEFEKSLMRYTILRLDDLFGVFARLRLSGQFEKMHTLVGTGANRRFVFMHFVAPHPPYVFRSDGTMRTRHQFTDHSWEPRDFYTGQLAYVSTKALELVSDIRRRDPGAIIVLQSDHGPWITDNSPENVFEARSQILYAIHANGLIPPLSAGSPVNTFRYLTNALFNTGFLPLNDSTAGKTRLYEDPIFKKKVSTK